MTTDQAATLIAGLHFGLFLLGAIFGALLADV
jgi:hypothetical protein